MISSRARRGLGVLTVAALASHLSGAADPAPARPTTGKIATPASTSSRPASSASRAGSARGPLPDPTLLDGSSQPAEKKSDHGMIGDFELPGDENVKSGKVGGPQNPNGQQGGGAQSNTPPAGMPQGGGAGQQSQQQAGQQPQQGGAQGGAQGAQAGGQQAGGQQGGAQAGGQQGQNAAGNPVAGGGDPGAQAQGIQVAELGGEASGQAQAGGGPGEKPQQVAIGDSAMRIEQSATAQAGVVGAQQPAGQTQQHEKGTGSGGKGSGGSGSGNRVEKGRVIPSGL